MANLSVGIIGLPNVGKSTLFNALLKKQVAYAANYPFATIEPNIGVVEVPDPRLQRLAEVVGNNQDTRKQDTNKSQISNNKSQITNNHLPPIIPAAVEFVDIAGLVAGASKGEGLGNKFLAHIREVAVIAHVVRLFEDSDIIRNAPQTSPDDDIAIIEEELMLADLATLEKQPSFAKASAGKREPRGNAPKEEIQICQVVTAVKSRLDQGTPVRAQKLSQEQRDLIRHLNLLTAKPVIYCFNCSLEQLEGSGNRQDLPAGRQVQTIRQLADQNSNYIIFNPLDETSVDELISASYDTLGLISFLTAPSSAKASEGQGGKFEVRAWTIPAGTDAQHAAGAIHTDFVKHFIKADVVSYEAFLAAGGWQGARDAGKVVSAGRDYVVKDGDIIDFKVGV